jgi:hypothetical protein
MRGSMIAVMGQSPAAEQIQDRRNQHLKVNRKDGSHAMSFRARFSCPQASKHMTRAGGARLGSCCLQDVIKHAETGALPVIAIDTVSALCGVCQSTTVAWQTPIEYKTR